MNIEMRHYNFISVSEKWCKLCHEPYASWRSHISGRVQCHATLEDLFYSYTTLHLRTWKPQLVYLTIGMNPHNILSFQQGKRVKSSRTSTKKKFNATSSHIVDNRKAHAFKRYMGEEIKNSSVAPANERFQNLDHGRFKLLYKTYDFERANHMHTLYNLILHLYVNKWLAGCISQDTRELTFRSLHGLKCINYILVRILWVLFLRSDTGSLSVTHQRCVDPYNLEVVFDSLRLGCIFHLTKQTPEAKAYQVRVIYSDIYGLLFWYTKAPIYIREIAEYVLKSLSAYVVEVQMIELSNRADRAWKTFGCPTEPNTFSLTLQNRIGRKEDAEIVLRYPKLFETL